jgi:hypothetical protein
MSVFELADFKEHLNIPAARTTDDRELQRHLDAAEDHVVSQCGSLGGTTTVKARLSPSGLLVLPFTPVDAITAVRDPSGAVVPLTAITADLDTGLVRVPYPAAGSWRIDVVREDATADLQLAVFIIAGHLWDTQRGNSPSSAVLQGGDDDAPVGAGYAIPNRAATLMGPHLVVGFA